jgi:hypothetical protein
MRVKHFANFFYFKKSLAITMIIANVIKPVATTNTIILSF